MDHIDCTRSQTVWLDAVQKLEARVEGLRVENENLKVELAATRSKGEPVPTPPDTFNKFGVGSMGTADNLVIVCPVPRLIPRDRALNLAAWIVAVAGVEDPDSELQFNVLLDAIKNT